MKQTRWLFQFSLAWTFLVMGSAYAGGLPDNPSDWVCKGSDQPVTEEQIQAWCTAYSDGGEPARFDGKPATLLDLEAKNAYDRQLREFLRKGSYLSWTHDQVWRLTGPYVGEIGKGKSYGVHPLVRIYYSPEMVDWLCAGRPDDIPDGAMIVKEMTRIDQDTVVVEKGCMRAADADIKASSWTVMVRHESFSADGWYWANPAGTGDGNPPILDRSAVAQDDFFKNPPQRDPRWYPTGDLFGGEVKGGVKLADVVYPYNLFGAYCVNCHASAEKLHTYSSMDNIIEEGIRYRHFPEDAAAQKALAASGSQHDGGSDIIVAEEIYESPYPTPLPKPSAAFVQFFGDLDPMGFGEVIAHRFPAETFDHHLSARDGAPRFVTSDQCVGCHNATSSNDGIPNMQIEDPKTGQWVNVSPYAEWRASPMGLAGRDPIFFSQLQSETIHFPDLAPCIESTCLHCHGVMGQRQYAYDTREEGDDDCKKLFGLEPPPEVPFGKPFRREMVTHWQSEPSNGIARYGSLARDGISCAVCHHISSRGLGEERGFTGNFISGRPDQVFGPYRNVVTKPMEHSLGIEPRYGEHMASSELCGSCHAILLPEITNEGQFKGYSYEQTTYLEWTNSDFARGATYRSCQDCHMPTHYKSRSLKGMRIANIESNRFAPTTNRLPDKEITLTKRDKFSRHSLHGLNVFLNQMFQQFPLLLGLRQIDYMVKPNVVPSLITGQQSMLRMAAQDTATLEIMDLSLDKGRLKADVLVTNKTGHYLPSGVGFRRAFLEFIVHDEEGNELWSSGKTNELGVILDCRYGAPGGAPTCTPLSSGTGGAKGPDYQPHYLSITKSDQAQIYQELIRDSDKVLTTSFLRRIHHIKDNRLRPKGYDPKFFEDNPSPYIKKLATCEGKACDDRYYYDPKLTGADRISYDIELGEEVLARVARITVRLLSQSIPPPYLRERFRDAKSRPGRNEDIGRLYYLTSHLNTGNGPDGGPRFIKDWKLEITRTCVRADGSACPNN